MKGTISSWDEMPEAYARNTERFTVRKLEVVILWGQVHVSELAPWGMLANAR